MTLVWVSGHSDLEGNEVADFLAREGVLLRFIGPEPILDISSGTVKQLPGFVHYIPMKSRTKKSLKEIGYT